MRNAACALRVCILVSIPSTTYRTPTRIFIYLDALKRGMAKKQKPAAPSKKYTPDEVLERFRAKDDPALGRYANYAASHREKLAHLSEKEKARQEKEQKKEEARKKQFEKAVTPEQLYQETAEAAVYEHEDDDGDMPSSDIKGKKFSDYQPLSSAPSPGKNAENESARHSITDHRQPTPDSRPQTKPSVRDLTRLFNQKFAGQKKEAEEKDSKQQKKETKKVTKKIIRKTTKSTSSRPPTPDSRPPAKSAPPLPPSKNVNPKYVKQHQEELKKQQEKDEKEEEKKEKAVEEKAKADGAKKEAEKAAADSRPSTADHQKRSPFKTGFWIMCGVLAFLIILVTLFFLAVVAISYLSGVPLVENGTIVLP